MPKSTSSGTQRFHNEDLMLEVSTSVDRRKWNEDKYDSFIDALCGNREYQKEAIYTALRYLLGGEYRDLRDLAQKNFEHNETLGERYGSFAGMEHQLQLPNQLSASLDLATGTGKSYVMYGIATIMLAEGAVDRVLVLCPSTTIESGLMEKFESLSGNADLRDLLPSDSVVNTPRIINASESITADSICIENYHAVLAHVRSSIKDSLTGKGERTLVLNDETHHVVNDSAASTKRWKEFLTDPSFGFKYIIGVSGTCYIGNEYFSDVIYRYSLLRATEERFVKRVQYVGQMPQTTRPEEEKWKLILNHHEEIRRQLKSHNIRPLTIVITRDIKSCKEVAENFKTFLVQETGKSKQQADERALVIHSDAPDLMRLPSVDAAISKVEWVFSVSMLNEGWDVKRVFQIVPHEKKAFDSKLLIAQVLGRGLRIPNKWTGEQPVVTVFNHDKWSDDIRNLVNEVMEQEKRVATFALGDSEFNFEVMNMEYDSTPYLKSYPKEGPYKLFEKGYVDLSRELAVEEVRVEFIDASTQARSEWRTKIEHTTYTPREIAEVMYQRFEDLPEEADQKYYSKQFPVDRLEEIVKRSLKETGNKAITEGIRQKFLQSLGTLQRKVAHVVRYDFEPKEYKNISTSTRQQEGASASELKNTKTLFFTHDTAGTIPEDQREFYDEVIEAGNGYKITEIHNAYDFKTPLNAVIADHDNERRFIRELTTADNAKHIDAWLKSTAMGFYEINYSWRKGEHPKRGRFSPDFFIKAGPLILVVEIKGDEEIKDPSPENKKKYEYASKHFERINKHLYWGKSKASYQFNFLSPADFNGFFQSIRDGDIIGFRSQLDVKLAEE